MYNSSISPSLLCVCVRVFHVCVMTSTPLMPVSLFLSAHSCFLYIYIHFFKVEWVFTETPFKDRFDYYKDPKFFEHKIHWFSIFNSGMMVIFLCGLVALILVRTLKNDFAKVITELNRIEVRTERKEKGDQGKHLSPEPGQLEGSTLIQLVSMSETVAVAGLRERPAQRRENESSGICLVLTSVVLVLCCLFLGMIYYLSPPCSSPRSSFLFL